MAVPISRGVCISWNWLVELAKSGKFSGINQGERWGGGKKGGKKGHAAQNFKNSLNEFNAWNRGSLPLEFEISENRLKNLRRGLVDIYEDERYEERDEWETYLLKVPFAKYNKLRDSVRGVFHRKIEGENYFLFIRTKESDKIERLASKKSVGCKEISLLEAKIPLYLHPDPDEAKERAKYQKEKLMNFVKENKEIRKIKENKGEVAVRMLLFVSEASWVENVGGWFEHNMPSKVEIRKTNRGNLEVIEDLEEEFENIPENWIPKSC